MSDVLRGTLSRVSALELFGEPAHDVPARGIKATVLGRIVGVVLAFPLDSARDDSVVEQRREQLVPKSVVQEAGLPSSEGLDMSQAWTRSAKKYSSCMCARSESQS